jgi:hypothetical protein
MALINRVKTAADIKLEKLEKIIQAILLLMANKFDSSPEFEALIEIATKEFPGVARKVKERKLLDNIGKGEI